MIVLYICKYCSKPLHNNVNIIKSVKCREYGAISGPECVLLYSDLKYFLADCLVHTLCWYMPCVGTCLETFVINYYTKNLDLNCLLISTPSICICNYVFLLQFPNKMYLVSLKFNGNLFLKANFQFVNFGQV